MKKKLTRILAVVLLLSVILTASAGAAGRGRTSGPNWRQMQTLYMMVDTANATIECMVIFAQLTPYDDVDWLLLKIEAVTAPVFCYAASIGATVQCQYESYIIDGRSVLIDPLMVIRENTGSHDDGDEGDGD